MRAREDGGGERRAAGFEDDGEPRVHRRMVVCSLSGVETSANAGGEREEKEGARDDGEEETPELVKLVVEGETACHVCDVTQVSSGQQQALYVHM